MKKFGTVCAICAAVASFMFTCLSIHFFITKHDWMIIPFAIIGILGTIVMWANRK